jgi:hypothetical protein
VQLVQQDLLALQVQLGRKEILVALPLITHFQQQQQMQTQVLDF